jgi:hypothetical protein
LLRLPAAADNAAMEAEPINAEPPKRNRRWYQFSLRTLMIGITLLAVACWVFEDQWRLIHERDEALKRRGNAMMQVEQARALARAEINQSVAVARGFEQSAERARQELEPLKADIADKE